MKDSTGARICTRCGSDGPFYLDRGKPGRCTTRCAECIKQAQNKPRHDGKPIKKQFVGDLEPLYRRMNERANREKA